MSTLNKKYSDRRWINKVPYATAFISFDASDGEMKIADCHKVTVLDFGLSEYSKSTAIDNIEYKIEQLYEVISSVRRGLKAQIRSLRKNLDKGDEQ